MNPHLERKAHASVDDIGTTVDELLNHIEILESTVKSLEKEIDDKDEIIYNLTSELREANSRD